MPFSTCEESRGSEQRSGNQTAGHQIRLMCKIQQLSLCISCLRTQTVPTPLRHFLLPPLLWLCYQYPVLNFPSPVFSGGAQIAKFRLTPYRHTQCLLSCEIRYQRQPYSIHHSEAPFPQFSLLDMQRRSLKSYYRV